MGWVDGGALHLDRGAYSLVLRLPAGTALEAVEVAPPCISPVEPLGGWSETAVTDSVDLAVTVVKAVDGESELPAAAEPIEASASSFREEAGGPGPRREVVFVDLPEAGLYTISAFGTVGGGQGWSADGCRKAMLCTPTGAAARASRWLAVMTAPFNAGRHAFTVTLVGDAAVERLRAERKKNSGADYVATLRRLGLDVGADGPISRAQADEAIAFVRRRAALLTGGCGDLTLPDSGLRVAGLQPAGLAAPGGPVQPGAGPNPIANPPVLLDVPAPTPAPTPAPSASPSLPGASPTPGPTPAPTRTAPPSPIPTQPPGSGVTPTPAP
jgi:hypothetical protein